MGSYAIKACRDLNAKIHGHHFPVWYSLSQMPIHYTTQYQEYIIEKRVSNFHTVYQK